MTSSLPSNFAHRKHLDAHRQPTNPPGQQQPKTRQSIAAFHTNAGLSRRQARERLKGGGERQAQPAGRGALRACYLGTSVLGGGASACVYRQGQTRWRGRACFCSQPIDGLPPLSSSSSDHTHSTLLPPFPLTLVKPRKQRGTRSLLPSWRQSRHHDAHGNLGLYALREGGSESCCFLSLL